MALRTQSSFNQRVDVGLNQAQVSDCLGLIESPEYKKCEFGVYNYSSLIHYACAINLDKDTLELYRHCYLMREFSFEESSGARKDSWAPSLLTWEDYR